MKKEDIHLADVHRILFGEAPAVFLAEVLVRTILIYFMLLIAVRLMGKRMGGQLTNAEMAVTLTLGAIVSPAMQVPNVGLLQGGFILLLALGFQRGLNWLEFRSQKLEELSHGKVSLLVKNGTLVLSELDKSKMSRQQLFAVLRNEGIFNLGQIERVYLESFGAVSIYEYDQPKPGLSMLPPGEQIPRNPQSIPEQQPCVCISCGNVVDQIASASECAVCGEKKWSQATLFT